MSSSNCCFLTSIQVSQEGGQVVWYSHLLQNFPQFIVIHTIKGFDIVNKAEIDVFLELSCFFDDPANAVNLISGSSAFCKSILSIWKFTVHVLLKPGLGDFERCCTSVCVHYTSFIYPFINGHLVCFPFATFVNGTTMDRNVRVSFKILLSSSFVSILTSGIAGSHAHFTFNFLRNQHAIFHSICVFHSHQ